MTWAFRRQLFFLTVFVIIVSILAFFAYQAFFNKPPTCFDGKQNGLEIGIDCGGSCVLSCLSEVDRVSLLWARAFEILPTRYNAVAYLENKNENNAVRKVSYTFRFSDKDNVFIGKRDGFTYIPTAGKFAVFEPAIDLGNSVPVYTTFEFTEVPIWEKVTPEKVRQLSVGVADINLVDTTTAPKLFATARNYSLFKIPELSLVAILYDGEGNAVSASRTYVDVLDREASVPVSFTWPKSFSSEIVVKEIIPLYDIFGVELK